MRSLFVSLLRDVIIPSPKSSFDMRVVKHVDPNSMLTFSALRTDVLKLS